MDINARSTAMVLQHHLDVLGAGDVEATLLDYAEDAFIITNDGVTWGKEEIRKFFTNSVENVLPPGSAFEMRQRTIEGEMAVIVWSAESPNYRIPFGTDTFVIRAGLIVAQSFVGLVHKK